jgi:hypothetical protein
MTKIKDPIPGLTVDQLVQEMELLALRCSDLCTLYIKLKDRFNIEERDELYEKIDIFNALTIVNVEISDLRRMIRLIRIFNKIDQRRNNGKPEADNHS